MCTQAAVVRPPNRIELVTQFNDFYMWVESQAVTSDGAINLRSVSVCDEDAVELLCRGLQVV